MQYIKTLAVNTGVDLGFSSYESIYIYDSAATENASRRLFSSFASIHALASVDTKHKKLYLASDLSLPDVLYSWPATTEILDLTPGGVQFFSNQLCPGRSLTFEGSASMLNVVKLSNITVKSINAPTLSTVPMFRFTTGSSLTLDNSVITPTRNTSSKRYTCSIDLERAAIKVVNNSAIKELALTGSSTQDRRLHIACTGLSNIEGFFAPDKPGGQTLRELLIESDGSMDYEVGTLLQDIEDSYTKFTLLEHKKRDSASINKVLTRPWSSTFLIDFSRHTNIEVYLLGSTSFGTVAASRKPRKQFTLRLYAGASDRDLFWNEDWKWNLNGNNPPDILFAGKELTIGLEIGPGITESDIKASILQSN